MAQTSVKNDLFTKFENLSSQNGLSNDVVLDIIQDNYGYMWIATNDGLNRYDGYSFKHYKNSIDDSTSISDNFITSLAIDNDNNLWVGTNNGLNKYNREENNFIRFIKETNNNSLSDNSIRTLLAEKYIVD